MTQPASQPATKKTTRWAFTAYEHQYSIIDNIDKSIVSWIDYQDEICPDTQRKHRQGCFTTHRQHYYKGEPKPPGIQPRPCPNESLRKYFPGIHVEPAWKWEALVNYCKKKDSRDLSGGHVTKSYAEYAPAKIQDVMTDLAKIYLELTSIIALSGCKLVMPADLGEQYWYLVSEYMKRDNHHLAGLLMQPGPLTLWKKTKSVWVERAISITPAPSEQSEDEQ